MEFSLLEQGMHIELCEMQGLHKIWASVMSNSRPWTEVSFYSRIIITTQTEVECTCSVE